MGVCVLDTNKTAILSPMEMLFPSLVGLLIAISNFPIQPVFIGVVFMISPDEARVTLEQHRPHKFFCREIISCDTMTTVSCGGISIQLLSILVVLLRVERDQANLLAVIS